MYGKSLVRVEFNYSICLMFLMNKSRAGFFKIKLKSSSDERSCHAVDSTLIVASISEYFCEHSNLPEADKDLVSATFLSIPGFI